MTCISFQEAKLCVKEKFNPSTVKYFVQFSLEWVLDRDTKRRKMVGQLYHDLILEKLLTVDQLLEGWVAVLHTSKPCTTIDYGIIYFPKR